MLILDDMCWRGLLVSLLIHEDTAPTVLIELALIEKPVVRSMTPDLDKDPMKTLAKGFEAFSIAPSNMPSQMHNFVDNPASLIEFNRPYDPTRIPIALMDEAFAEFSKCSQAKPTIRSLKFLEDLTLAMTKYYPKKDGKKGPGPEDFRMRAVDHVLAKYLTYNLPQHTFPGSVGAPYTIDGIAMEYPFAFIMRECKDAPADAIPQLIAYYVHYIKTITHSEETEHLQRSDTRFPTLGLVDTGATIDSSTYIFLY